ncbi:hypothetical protein SAN_0333, partial [Streptococcus agalactiae COH1]
EIISDDVSIDGAAVAMQRGIWHISPAH